MRMAARKDTADRRDDKLQRTKRRLNHRALRGDIKMPLRKNRTKWEAPWCILRHGHANPLPIGTSYGVAKRLAADTSGSQWRIGIGKKNRAINWLRPTEETTSQSPWQESVVGVEQHCSLQIWRNRRKCSIREISLTGITITCKFAHRWTMSFSSDEQQIGIYLLCKYAQKAKRFDHISFFICIITILR